MLSFLANNLWSLLLLGILTVVVYYLFGKSSHDDDDTDSDDEFEDIKSFVDDGRPKMLILYGTQTGTSEDYSKMLESDAQQYGFNAISMDMNQVRPEELQREQLMICLLSTYGEGDPPDGARDFYEAIHTLSPDKLDLSNLKYSVFGLGNSQYKHYQAMSRFFDKKFKTLGAHEVFPRGEGDVDINLEEAYEDWKTNLLNKLSTMYNTQISEEKIEPKYDLQWLEDVDPENTAPFYPPRGIPDSKYPIKAKVIESKQLLPAGSERSTVHVEFDIKSTKVNYEAGDHLAIYARNDQSLVYKYAARLGAKDRLQTAFSFQSKNDKSKGHQFPRKCTLFDVFTYFLDLTSLPRKKFIRAMAWYAADREERRELEKMSANTDDGKALFNSFVRSPKHRAIDLLNKYKSVEMPLELFMELVPTLPPRYYSIASAKSLHPHAIHAVVAVVRYKTPLGKDRGGVCSTYMEGLNVGDEVYLYVRPSTFHLPRNTKKPVIMIGPGTGYAPLRGFLQQRTAQKEKGKELGEAYLFFGCRNKNEDWIYGEEMTEAQQNGVITSLCVAFSRDQSEKVYVQHRMEEMKEELFQALEKGGYVYICGDAKYMAKQVHDTLFQIVKECGHMVDHDALKYMEKLENNGRYLKDVGVRRERLFHQENRGLGWAGCVWRDKVLLKFHLSVRTWTNGVISLKMRVFWQKLNLSHHVPPPPSAQSEIQSNLYASRTPQHHKIPPQKQNRIVAAGFSRGLSRFEISFEKSSELPHKTRWYPCPLQQNHPPKFTAHEILEKVFPHVVHAARNSSSTPDWQQLVTQRDLFYKVIHRGFRNQQEVNEMILDVGAVLEAPRIEMGICASSKGFVGGNLQWRHKSMGGARSFLEKDVSWFDVSKHEYGVPISGSVVWTEYDVHSEARVILIVEKEGIFHRLMEDCFSSVLPSIIVTGCGFPDLSTRMLVHRLHSVLQIPVLCLVDYNPFGYQIFTTFAHGSARMGMETSHYSLPHTQWLGLRHEDTQNIHPSQKQPFTMLDEQKANELLCCLMAEEQQSVTAATNETNIRELFLMSQNKYKVELQVLYNSLGLTNFSYYIRELIKKRYPEISSNPSWDVSSNSETHSD
eukprot:CAMPEP_0117439988 /NCGR_PEP_ID=MMETSP0759-20121206/2844_1 /TAXON_ID=63605 /ORGANISM="Percolomonas cosmopolitus, Strain WS" /LENGTH=1100 /DNA_ID=CAMNT_0005231711 /DNA_START=1124 /DNA_END=4427 /DNA_ORIENTATION=+